MLITPEYRQALLAMHSKYNWGCSGGKYAGDSIVSLLQKYPEIQTILDYGCGEGALKEWIEDKGITDKTWTLYDPGMSRWQKEPKGKFDLVITTDVLEHVEEPMLNSVVKHLHDLTGRFLYNEIACYFSKTKFGDGPYVSQDLHINLKAPDAWKLRLERPTTMETIESVSSVIDGWKVRYLLIQKVRFPSE